VRARESNLRGNGRIPSRMRILAARFGTRNYPSTMTGKVALD